MYKCSLFQPGCINRGK